MEALTRTCRVMDRVIDSSGMAGLQVLKLLETSLGSHVALRSTHLEHTQALCAAQPPDACRYSQAELEALDNQGRCIITDHHAFVLFNLYLPASTRPGQTNEAGDQTNEAGDRYQHKLRMLQARPSHCSTDSAIFNATSCSSGGRKCGWAKPAYRQRARMDAAELWTSSCRRQAMRSDST